MRGFYTLVFLETQSSSLGGKSVILLAGDQWEEGGAFPQGTLK